MQGTYGTDLPITYGNPLGGIYGVDTGTDDAGVARASTYGDPFPATYGQPYPATYGNPEPGVEPARVPGEYAITLFRNGDRLVLQNVNSVSVSRPTSEVGTLQVSVPYADEELAQWRFADVTLTYDERTLFVGQLREVDPDSTGVMESTQLTIAGPGLQLKSGDLEVSYENVHYAEAIEDFWSEYTDFTATVTEGSQTIADEGLVLQEATDSNTFGLNTEIEDTDPFVIEDGQLRLAQTGFFREANDYDDEFETALVEGDEYSDGESRSLRGAFEELQFNFELEYTIPADEVMFAFRNDQRENEDHAPFVLEIDDQTVMETTSSGGLLNHSWFTSATGVNSDLEPGTHTATIRVNDEEYDSDDEALIVDCIWVGDDRFNHDFDNEVHEPAGYLDGPEHYPDNVTLEFDDVESERSIEAAHIDLGIDDTSGSQSIGVTFDGETWETVPNTNSASWTSGDTATRSVQGRVTLSGYPEDENPQDATPRFGYEGQTVSSWELSVDTSIRTAIDDQTFEGTPLEILDELHNRGGFSWYIDVTRGERAYSFPQSRAIRSPSIQPIEDGHNPTWDTTDYYNSVIVYGQRKEDGERYSGSAQDEEEIERRGEVGPWPEYTDLESDQDCRAYAESLLQDFLENDERSGSVDMVPRKVDPGTALVIDEWDEERRVGPYSLYFDGESSIRLPTAALSDRQNGGIAMWVKAPFRTAGHNAALFGGEYHQNEGYFRSSTDRYLELRIGGPDGIASVQAFPNADPPRDEWILLHYDWVYSSEDNRTTVRAGHDGEIQTERGFVGKFEPPDDLLRIGRNNGYYYQGYVDYVTILNQAPDERIYQRLVDRNRIPSRYISSQYPLNEGPDRVGEPAYDVFGGHHATLEGNAEYRGSPFSVEEVSYSESSGEFSMNVSVGEAESFAEELASRRRDVRDLRKRG